MELTSKDWFALDGVSCGTVGLYCDTPPAQIMAERKGKSYYVGGDEEIYKDDDSFADISFRFNCYAFFPESFDTSVVFAYLQSKRKLTMSRNDGYFYRIRSISCSTSETADGSRIKYQITVKCAPFRYIDGEDAVVISGSGAVTNNGTRYCKPVYTITLSANYGQGTLTVNGHPLTITIPDTNPVSNGKIIIDADLEMAYGTDGSNRTMQTAGIFRFLAVGVNVVELGGICQSVSIKRNGRCY
jgi:phage-related protein